MRLMEFVGSANVVLSFGKNGLCRLCVRVYMFVLCVCVWFHTFAYDVHMSVCVWHLLFVSCSKDVEIISQMFCVYDSLCLCDVHLTCMFHVFAYYSCANVVVCVFHICCYILCMCVGIVWIVSMCFWGVLLSYAFVWFHICVWVSTLCPKIMCMYDCHVCLWCSHAVVCYSVACVDIICMFVNVVHLCLYVVQLLLCVGVSVWLCMCVVSLCHLC